MLRLKYTAAHWDVPHCTARFLYIKNDRQISLSFWSWVTHWIKSMQSITEVLVLQWHKNSIWHTSDFPFWREMAGSIFGKNYLTDLLSKHAFLSPSYSEFLP